MCKLPAMAPLSYPAGKVVQFAVVARLNTKHKGQDFALAALALNEWESRKWHLNFYGTGSDADYLADLVEFYGLNERVSFHGHVHDIADVWRRNHALLLTSIAEGAPQALIEAMYCGRIGIVTDVGDSACLVEDERNGFIIPAPTICLVSRTLEKAWRKRNEWPEMGESAAQDIRRYIDPNPERTLLAKLATLAS